MQATTGPLSDSFELQAELGQFPDLASQFFFFAGETVVFDKDGWMWTRKGDSVCDPGQGYVKIEVPLLWETEPRPEAYWLRGHHSRLAAVAA
ncbi:MAG TPA: hypothetical protein VGE35_02230 [Candidatus Paceibacterota bacterium]